jgi:hypothetical protein
MLKGVNDIRKNFSITVITLNINIIDIDKLDNNKKVYFHDKDYLIFLYL